jgi:hypothetical protein
VNTDVGVASQDWPDIAFDQTGRFTITWEDTRDGNADIFAQKFNASGSPLDTNYLVNNRQSTPFTQEYPAITANGDAIYLSWQDNRRDKGWDIFAKAVAWNWPTDITHNNTPVPTAFQLSQNYPNPFNPVTTIRYEIARRAQVSVDVFNIVGQQVRSLVHKSQEPGSYEVIWDGKDANGEHVASGMYFYRLRADQFVQTKKMLLLK